MEFFCDKDWGLHTFIGSVVGSSSVASGSDTVIDVTQGSTDRDISTMRELEGRNQGGSYIDASHNNVLSDQAIFAIKRQRNQNSLIHLDPIPDFKDKKEIKPWLQKIFYPQGIELVIERSDKIKIVFKCKASKRGKAGDSLDTRVEVAPARDEVPSEVASEKHGKKRAVSPYNICPFRVRAAYSLKRKKWSIVVVNNSHSHELKFNSSSEEYKKFKKKLREDQDWCAVKKFDELEYRSKFNLSTNPTPIPCDCGLTQEIESFNVILPSNNIVEPLMPLDIDKQMNLLTKSQAIFKSTQSCENSQRGIIRSDLENESQFIAQGNDCDVRTNKKRTVAAVGSLSYSNKLFQNSNEIDFTEIFLKSSPHFERKEDTDFLSQDKLFKNLKNQDQNSNGNAAGSTRTYADDWDDLKEILDNQNRSEIEQLSYFPSRISHNISTAEMHKKSASMLFDLSDLPSSSASITNKPNGESLNTTNSFMSKNLNYSAASLPHFFSPSSYCSITHASDSTVTDGSMPSNLSSSYPMLNFNYSEDEPTTFDTSSKNHSIKHSSYPTLHHVVEENKSSHLWENQLEFM